MNININIRNKSKLIEILRGIPTKLHVLHVLTVLDYKNWFFV